MPYIRLYVWGWLTVYVGLPAELIPRSIPIPGVIIQFLDAIHSPVCFGVAHCIRWAPS